MRWQVLGEPLVWPPQPPTPHSLMPGAAMVILETTTCVMPFTAALCKQEQ